MAARLEAFSLSEKTFKDNILPRIDIRKESGFNGEAKQNRDPGDHRSRLMARQPGRPHGHRTGPEGGDQHDGGDPGQSEDEAALVAGPSVNGEGSEDDE